MRLESTIVHHVTHTLRDRTLVVPWADYGPGIIAVRGPNKSGKTHLLEASGPTALFGVWPYYGEPFIAHVPPGVRDARIETAMILGGRRFRLKWEGDRVANKGRGQQIASLVELDAEGNVVGTPVSGVTEFKRRIAELVMPPAFFYCSAYGAQTSRESPPSIAGLDKAARKDLVIKLLGGERWQTRAERAKTRGDRVDEQLAALRQRIADLRPRVARWEALAPLLADAADLVTARSAAVATAEAAATTAAAELATARAVLARLEDEIAAITGRNAERAAQRTTLTVTRTERQTALAALDGRMARAAEIRTAADRLRVLDETVLPQARAQVASCQTALEAARREESTLAERLAQLKATYATLAKQAPPITKDAPLPDHETLTAEIGRMEAALPTLRADVDRIAQAQAGLDDEAATERDALTTRRLRTQERAHLVAEAGRLQQLEDGSDPKCGRCPFSRSAVAARARVEAIDTELATLPALPADGAQPPATAAAAANRTAHQQAAAAVQAAEAALATARVRVDLVANVEQGRATKTEAATAAGATQGAQAAADEAAATARGYEQERARVASVAAELPALESATATATALRTQLRDVEAALAAIGADEAVPDATDTARAVDTATAAAEERDAAAVGAREARDQAQREHDRLAGERDALGNVPAQLQPLEKQELVLVRELGHCRILQRDCGRDGIQAVLIDRAGPEVSAIINGILQRCYGGQYAVTFTTTQPRADGKGTTEVFDLQIVDGAGNAIAMGSGGEQAIIDEAIRIGFAIYNVQRSGCPIETLWRDETGAHLDPEHAQRWLAMLRAAREIGGFHQIIIVSHTERVWTGADVVLSLVDGELVVTDGPGALELARQGDQEAA